jgi:mycoredoxin-dependent peroxiredoxin
MVEIGDEAPDFELRDQRNQPVRLSDLRGQRNVVLLFYPFTFTSVCATELAAIRDDLPTYQNDDVQVLAVSCDTTPSHRVWDEQEHFGFPLLADFWPHGETARAYGVFDDSRGCATRGTFIIDRAGVVRWKVVNAVPDARDQDDYVKVLAEL